MTELKTLKDLGFKNVNEYSDAEFILKQEAIKWVKAFDKDHEFMREEDIIESKGAKDIFTKFFNLTEEDLK